MRLECIHDLFLISFAGLPPTTDISVVFLATTALAHPLQYHMLLKYKKVI